MKPLLALAALSLLASGGWAQGLPLENTASKNEVEGLGVATWRRHGAFYGGIGVGSYKTYFSHAPGGTSRRLGGKIFFGFGASGTLFLEWARHSVGHSRENRNVVSLGLRI
jgi:hypothetical protein